LKPEGAHSPAGKKSKKGLQTHKTTQSKKKRFLGENLTFNLRTSKKEVNPGSGKPRRSTTAATRASPCMAWKTGQWRSGFEHELNQGN